MARPKRKRKQSKVQAQPAAQLGEVNRFAAAHGDYGQDVVVDLMGELGGGRQKTYPVTRNRGGTTVERWLAAGDLTRPQAEAISLYARAHRMSFGEQRVTANWSLTATIRGMDAGTWVDAQANALGTIRDMDRYVLKNVPPVYRDCWQNVVLFDEPAGTAGSRLGFRHKGAEATAKVIVQLIAGMIATHYRLG